MKRVLFLTLFENRFGVENCIAVFNLVLQVVEVKEAKEHFN